MRKCRGKIVHRDRIAAEMAMLKALKRLRPKDRDEQRTYRCPVCRGWHVTSQPADPGRGRRGEQ